MNIEKNNLRSKSTTSKLFVFGLPNIGASIIRDFKLFKLLKTILFELKRALDSFLIGLNALALSVDKRNILVFFELDQSL